MAMWTVRFWLHVCDEPGTYFLLLWTLIRARYFHAMQQQLSAFLSGQLVAAECP